MSGGTSVYTQPAPAVAARAAGAGAGTVPGGLAVVVRSSGMTNVPVPVLPSQGQEIAMAREWPLRSFLELGAYPGAVPCARLHTRQLLWEWGQTGLGEGIELVVDELVTNAIKASRSVGVQTAIRLWLFSDKEKVLVMVWDPSRKPPEPVRQDSGELRDSGRGLMLVDALSERWEWYFAGDTGGKVVWALCGDATRAGKEE
jgi:anti-sigma regulatory factor (Ser/Thr protein kinase)